MTLKVHAIYFSPVRSTAKVVKTIARSISDNIEIHDVTKTPFPSVNTAEDEIAVIGVPSFSGRVPETAKERLAQIKADGTPAILVCLYGNRAYEDTLLELRDICAESGFSPLSAGAFIARHTIFSGVAQERPDTNDINTARDFGKQSIRSLTENSDAQLILPGNFPYKERMTPPLKPVVNDNCKLCGKCATLCPVGAIDESTPNETNYELCISCTRCIHGCKQNARSFAGEKFEAATQAFIEKNSARKEIELFYINS